MFRVDIDWEYPNYDGKSPQDTQNFVLLLNTLKQTLGTTYSLSVALGVGPTRTELSYDIPAIFSSTDFVSLKTYNLRGDGDTVTGVHSVLYDSLNVSVNTCVTDLNKFSVAKEKIVLGIPMYGYGFALKDPTKNGIGAPATAVGPIKYYDICPRVKAGLLANKYESASRVSYAFNENEWIGYEDLRSVKEKSNFIRNSLLGGAMIRTLDTDDYNNKCGDGT